MAKTKHELLAVEITTILSNIDRFIEKNRRCLQLVQFHFYTKILPINVPPPSSEVLISLAKPHAIGMRILGPSIELRNACSSCPIFCAILRQPVLFKSQCPFIPPNTTFATWWAVQITLPHEMEPLIEQGYWETLLYCPENREHAYHIDWFEKENHVNSFMFQTCSVLEVMGREHSGKKVIRQNLDQLALPHFRKLVEKWMHDPMGLDNISKDPSIVFTNPFAPTESDNIAYAYDKVRRAIRERSFRNYEYLLSLWRDFLENLMFINVDWTNDEKDGFIKEWEINIFGRPLKAALTHDGRWAQDMAIDRKTAGKLVKYFIDRFLADPLKRKKDGEAACFFWTLIWLAQDADTSNITLKRVLAFDTTNIDKDNPIIVFDGRSVKISIGLHRLLTILQGKGSGNRSRLIFAHLSDSYLQHAMKEASIALFGPNMTPILPAAFLCFPHSMNKTRLSRKERARLRAIDPGAAASYARYQILEFFREIQSKAPFFRP
jgi:hypothetical protein